MYAMDVSPVLHYDAGHPGFAVTYDQALGLWPPFQVDLDANQYGVTIPVGYDLDAARANQSGGLLLLHWLNGMGKRGEMVPVDGLTCETNADCPTPEKQFCEPMSGICVACVDNSNCLGGQYCDAYGTRECITDCTLPWANACLPGQYCDELAKDCVSDCRWQGSLPCAAGSYCSTESGLCVVANALVVTTPVDPGAECPTGGVKIETGIDDNGNMVLDPAEVDSTSYVCNGLRTIVDVEDVAPGEGGCATGGKVVYMGVDDNSDGVLQESERDQFFYVCNGNDGLTSLVSVTTEEPGANCAAGGKKVETGIDDNADGTLQSAEVDNTAYICNGADGANGKQALATVTDEPAGDNCATGGKKIETGIDGNGDGILQADEVDNTEYVCNGADGATGGDGSDGNSSLVETSAISPGSDCAAGGVLVKTGLDANGNGVLDPDEVTSVTAVCKGEKGSGGCAAAPSASGATPAAFLLLLGLFLLRRR
jgi:hypothetical protein